MPSASALPASLLEQVIEVVTSRERAAPVAGPTAGSPPRSGSGGGGVGPDSQRTPKIGFGDDDSLPSSKRAALDLSPDSDEEAFELLVANVSFISAPVMAFARLANPIQVRANDSHSQRTPVPLTSHL